MGQGGGGVRVRTRTALLPVSAPAYLCSGCCGCVTSCSASANERAGAGLLCAGATRSDETSATS